MKVALGEDESSSDSSFREASSSRDRQLQLLEHSEKHQVGCRRLLQKMRTLLARDGGGAAPSSKGGPGSSCGLQLPPHDAPRLAAVPPLRKERAREAPGIE